MNETEINQAFFALTDNLELDADGHLDEYISVDTQVQELLELHRDRIAQYPSADTLDEDEIIALQQEFKSSIWMDFTELFDDLRLHDEIVATGDTFALIIDMETETFVEKSLADGSHLYGAIRNPCVIQNPAASELDKKFNRQTTEFGLTFEISNAIFVTGNDIPNRIPSNYMVLLFIDCPGTKLKKALRSPQPEKS